MPKASRLEDFADRFERDAALVETMVKAFNSMTQFLRHITWDKPTLTRAQARAHLDNLFELVEELNNALPKA